MIFHKHKNSQTPQPRHGWAPDPPMVGIRSPIGLVVGSCTSLEFWVRFPNERNQGKQAHPVLKYRVPHGSQCVTSGLIHTGLGSSSIIAHVVHSPPPPPANSFVIGPAVINTHTPERYTAPRTSLDVAVRAGIKQTTPRGLVAAVSGFGGPCTLPLRRSRCGAHKNAAAEARAGPRLMAAPAPIVRVRASSLRLLPSPHPAAEGHAARCTWRRQVLKRCDRETQLVASQQTSLVCARLRCSVTTRSRRRNRLWPSGLQYNARHMQIA